MTVTVTMRDTRRGEDGNQWEAGQPYSASDAFAAYLIGAGLATGTLPVPLRASGQVQAVLQDGGAYALTLPDASVLALSETVEEVLADPSATTQILTGPGEYCHYRCTTATGNITVYDNTSSSGKLLVPTTALVLGTHPIFGAGDPRSLIVSVGIRVVLSGAGVAYIGRRVY